MLIFEPSFLIVLDLVSTLSYTCMMSVQMMLFGYKNVLHVYLPLSSTPGMTISYFCHEVKRRGEGVQDLTS